MINEFPTHYPKEFPDNVASEYSFPLHYYNPQNPVTEPIPNIVNTPYIGQPRVSTGEAPAIRVLYHDPDLIHIERTDKGDWIDLRTAEDVEMKAGEFRIISLGVSVQLPDGYEAHIVPRSSTFKRWGILQTNSFGIIDNSYSGPNDIWGFPALAMRDTVIHKNERICQFRIVPVMGDVIIKTVEELQTRDRGGFGSTGTV